MVRTEVIIKLLEDTNKILRHQKEISNLKGENFNIFWILKMESKENETHSAFLGELLDPLGSHNLGPIFLQLFFKSMGIGSIDIETAKVKLEQFVGERDDVAKTGGRVDIFIYDNDYNTLCIENKIYAPDQNVQIQRYCGYNGDKNQVFYLTLEGDEPSETSKGNLISGEHYYNLSYATDIIEWLNLCLKEVSTYPILRETINQYIILIKKLTNQLTDTKMENEIQNLIIHNYSATKSLEAHVRTVEKIFALKFLEEIKLELQKELKEDWVIEAYHDLDKPWTGLYINHKDWPEKVYVKLEGQSKVPWSDSIYGIIGNEKVCDRKKLNEELGHIEFLQEDFKSNKIWPFYKTILHFTNDESRAVLFDDKQRKELALNLSEKFLELARACEEPLKKVHKIDKKHPEVNFN